MFFKNFAPYIDIFTFSGTENCCLIPPAESIAEQDWYVLSLSITAIFPAMCLMMSVSDESFN